MRLVKAVAKGTQGAEREVLQELITSNERLLAEKEQVQLITSIWFQPYLLIARDCPEARVSNIFANPNDSSICLSFDTKMT